MTDSQINAAGYSSRGEFIEMKFLKPESQEVLLQWQMMVMTSKVADDAKAVMLLLKRTLVLTTTTSVRKRSLV